MKGNQKAILENLTKERLRICNIAKEDVEHRNVWTADEKIFAKCRGGSVRTLAKSAHLGQITSDKPAVGPGAITLGTIKNVRVGLATTYLIGELSLFYL